MNSCDADSSTAQGFWVTGVAADCGVTGIKAISKGTYGVQIDTGCANTIVSGPSKSNGTAPITGRRHTTASTGLVTV